MADDALLDRVRRAVRGRFNVIGELGRGGMAVVYLAQDPKLARDVAIKVMLPELAASQRMAERFLEEARVLAKQHHPNVIAVHSVDSEAGLRYFVMHLVDGPSLDRVRRQGVQLSTAAAICLLIDVAQALHHAHTHGVVHRDVKPSNILLAPDGRAIVTDFGIARVVDSEGLTLTGMLVGTPAYMSPEQWTGASDVTGATDQYALGVVGYELFTRELPFRGSALQLQWAHVHQPPPRLLDVCPSCPPGVANALMRMLEKQPTARYGSLDDVVSVLDAELKVDEREARRELASIAATLRPERDVVARGHPSPPTDIPRTAVLRLSPSVVRIEVGETVEVLARAIGGDRQVLPDVDFEWTVSDDSIARVDARAGQAHITAVAPGKTMFTVTTSDEFRRSGEVIVQPEGTRKREQDRSNFGSFAERVLTGAVAIVLLALVRMGPQLGQWFQRPPSARAAPATVPKGGAAGATIRVVHRSAAGATLAPNVPLQSGGTTAIPTVGQPTAHTVTPVDQAFGSTVERRQQPDSGDAAFAFNHLLLAIRDHDIPRFVALTSPNSFGGRAAGSRAVILVARATLRAVSIRNNDPEFIEAVARALQSGQARVPFFAVLDDPDAARDGERAPHLHFTATIRPDASRGGTFTEFRLDSIVSSVDVAR
jgi:hypothetical protein